MFRFCIIITLTLTLNGCRGLGGTQETQPVNPTPEPTTELSPAAKCRGKYTPTNRTVWVPTPGTNKPEWEGDCTVAAGARG